MHRNQFKNAIRRAWKSSGVTAHSFAKTLGVTPRQFFGWMDGAYMPPPGRWASLITATGGRLHPYDFLPDDVRAMLPSPPPPVQGGAHE